jgi:putative ABC transport system substrate-binding protein
MRRRDLIAGGAAAWPLAARAQQPAMPVIGFINSSTLETSERYVAAFRKGLSETGYIEGQNVIVNYHWLEGRYDRLPSLMADLVRRRVAVIAIPGVTTAVPVAKAATTTIPNVFGVADDPVRLRLVGRQPEQSGSSFRFRQAIPPTSSPASCGIWPFAGSECRSRKPPRAKSGTVS